MQQLLSSRVQSKESDVAWEELLTAIERGGDQAEIIAGLAHQVSGNTHVVGITGAPGSGKSTLTGRLLKLFSEAGDKLAVLAVDPSSPLTGGAILGDRIRMDDLAGEESFIRSMATGATLEDLH